MAALADPEAEVALRAAEALAAREHSPPLDALQAAAAQHGATGALARLLAQADPQSAALAQAARDGDPTALDHLADPDALAELLGGPHAVAAALGLARLGQVDALIAHAEPAVRAVAARHLPADHAALPGLATDPDESVAWLARQAAAGAYRHPEDRLGPHARSHAASAQAPYGLRPGDAVPEVERAPAALALCQTSFDVNLGVAVRSAEAAGLREVFVVGHRALFKSPARGTDQVIPVTALPDPAALIRRAREAGYQIVAVQQTPRSVPYHTADYPPRPLFVLGAEGEGLPDALRLAADLVVEIPLFGVIDSLNVAAAATTVMFHWRVHRGA
ncbi:MAG: hypothetical protein H6702_16235 [Myxococcales bacterium]|nr:hypothetical protein [Myxococcales bacterium]